MVKWSLIVSALGVCRAAWLPSHPTASLVTEEAVHAEGTWWARVGDTVFYPPSPKLGLSQEVTDYYYAAGNEGALTQEMRARRVGGDRLWHIFHLPEGPSALKMPKRTGGRRSSLSALVKLRKGTVLKDEFPPYVAKPGYAYPGSSTGQSEETNAVGVITPELVKGYLKDLTTLGDGKSLTRSYSNPDATEKTLNYLEKEFKALNLSTCLHTFKDPESPHTFTNVVAYSPGSGKGTLTVGAHYDSRPFEGDAPGALDNGSGVAAMLAAAKAFAQSKIQTNRSLFFVAFAAEEIGLVGSNAFAATLRKESGSAPLPAPCKQPPPASSSAFLGGKVAQEHAAIIMDEVGWRSPKKTQNTINFETYDWADPVMRHLFEANKLHNGQNMHVIHSNNPFGSDHMAFLERELPGVLIINADDSDYPDYHKSTDVIENVDMDYLSQVGKMIFGGLVRVAKTQP